MNALKHVLIGVALSIVLTALAFIVWFEGWRFFDERDRCLDGGGRWHQEMEACECTYAQRGSTSPDITADEYAACRIDPAQTTFLFSLDGKGAREAGG